MLSCSRYQRSLSSRDGLGQELDESKFRELHILSEVVTMDQNLKLPQASREG